MKTFGKAGLTLLCAALLFAAVTLTLAHFHGFVRIDLDGCAEYENSDGCEDVEIINAFDDERLDNLKLYDKAEILEHGSLIISRYKIERVKRLGIFSHFVKVYVSDVTKDNSVYVYRTKEKVYFDERYNVSALITRA